MKGISNIVQRQLEPVRISLGPIALRRFAILSA